MPGSRQDAWTQDEDLILAEIVLRHIREGSTQLVAFEEVGKKLVRTPAACGFRWNSYVRKQYHSGIELAKKQRKERKKLNYRNEEIPEDMSNHIADDTPETNTTLTLSKVIAFLEKLQADGFDAVSENEKIQKSLRQAEEENVALKEELSELQERLSSIEDDYRSLIEVMDKARKMVILDDENKNKVKFQMDKNGNLERVKK
ncbi:RsfA family transcriptional regulator [Bacillus sp. AGMB 02131]|uniref:RsfA family transcriptional regulator n=1 Tax=Peribacillus faecalis TaxID=2772559 RepID=A0A927H8T1_9BACI|nr:RsfA family transcriptional regulator [Peribacillus faecalis]MBD3106835.1 RsfA family transcriptional regulator [Peribacillus faecalis]